MSINISNQDGQLVVTSRQIAEDFEKRHSDVLEKIEDLFKTEKSVMTMFIESSYKAGTGKEYKEYLITRDGFSLLVMGFTGAKALNWKLKYINAFNEMEQMLKETKPACIEDVLIQSLQEMKDMKQQLNQVTRHALEAKHVAREVNEEVQGIRDVVAINTSTISWREDCRKIIVKIANKLGGNSFIGDVNREVYELMKIRLKVRLDVKLTNLCRRMAEEGVCKSKRDKMNYLDVIKDDARLVEGYVSIVKELAIKYRVA